MFYVLSLTNSFFNSQTYMLANDRSDDVWLMDCGDVEQIVRHIGTKTLLGVMLTHAHFDHIYGLNDLLKQFPDALVYTNECGKEGLLNARKNMSFLTP